MSGIGNPPQEEDKKPNNQSAHINLKVKGQVSFFFFLFFFFGKKLALISKQIGIFRVLFLFVFFVLSVHYFVPLLQDFS
ncbi:hypothetical protein Pint_15952 [Pistacia integerrima]|uniref:Uncharacterized protein n=1 Tax=Pistacia integerrima TaxID=434235 RepID=A0ACC0Z7X1_9ROSI|nr:hypothetical protein Pint_15952 [Pistacia integerrima]